MTAAAVDRPRRAVVNGLVAHWCPRRGLAWTCPSCGERFTRRSEDHAWGPR